MTRVAAPIACVACVVCAFGASCQLFGERARCDRAREDTVHACAVDEFCDGDGFCTKQHAIESCAPTPQPAARNVHISVAPRVGVEELGGALFGVKAALSADVHACNLKGPAPSTCDGQTQNPAGTQPLGALDPVADADRATSTVLAGQALVFPSPSSLDPKQGFSLEAIVKTPPRAPSTGGRLTPIVSMAAATGDGASFDGWILGVDDDDELVLAAGRATVFLTQKQTSNLAGVWHHVLCSVDAPALASPEAVLCAVDGKLVAAAPGQTSSSGTLLSPHALVFGGLDGSAPSSSGAEAAIVQVWATGRPEPGLRTLDREDALRDEARARLARYLGVAISVSPRFFVTNQAGLPRAQPITSPSSSGAGGAGAGVHFEIVDESWPRLARAADGTAAILLEPSRVNRLSKGVTSCGTGQTPSLATAASPDGRADACNYTPTAPATTVALPISDVTPIPIGRDPDFGTGSDFVLSAFLRIPTLASGAPNDGASLHFHVEGARGPGFAHNSDCLLDRNATGVPQLAGAGCEIESFAGGWVRLIARMTATSSDLIVSVDASGDVWSPQLELGTDPTTPMAFDPLDANANDRQRLADVVVFEAAGLASSASTALRADVISDTQTLAMTPLFVAEDAANFADGSAFVSAVSTAAGRVEPRLVVEHGATSVVLGDEVDFAPHAHTKLGADLGVPIDPCRGCASLPAPQLSLPAPEQWDHVGLNGSGEPGLLIDAEVLTQGTEPVPLALDITTDAPAPGCLEGVAPDVALVACAQGACPERSPVTWGGRASPVAGPSVGELAVDGAFVTKIAAPKVVEELFFEVRFAGKDGDVLTLAANDAKDTAPFLRVSDVHGAAVVRDGSGNTVLNVDGALGDGEWNQISCWVGLQSVCAINAGELVETTAAVDVAKPLGAVNVAGLVSFARVWRTSASPKSVVERVVGARVASSFGFTAPARRAEYELVEERAASATVERNGATFRVGAHWPRIVAGDNGPVYVSDSDDEKLTITTRDLSNFDATTVDMSFDNAPVGTLLAITNAGATETLTLSRNGSALDVVHDDPSVGAIPTATLDGIDANTVLFGARDSVFTLEGVATPPTLLQAAAPASFGALTTAKVGAHVQLRHLRLATR